MLTNTFYAHFNINKPVIDALKQTYDCALSVGVFTPGHVPSESLSHLAALTKPGGLIIVSTRVEYYESTGYQVVSDALEAAGEVTWIHSIKNARYANDGDAHYWVYTV